MKTLLIAVLCLACLGGCGKGEKQVRKEIKNNTRTVVIDGCEYLTYVDSDSIPYKGFGYAGITHKGNCRFCKEN
jgi:hypothetical protein